MAQQYVPKHMASPVEVPAARSEPGRVGRGRAGRGRVDLFDFARGVAIISMIVFHTCYDLAYLAQLPSFAWFADPLEDIWRATISWTFLIVAGCMCLYSRNNFKRAAKYLIVAALVWFVTSLAQMDTPISFGIIYCMGACTLWYAIRDQFGIAPRGYVSAILCLLAFFALLGLKDGTIWAFGANLRVPAVLYTTHSFDWVGLPGPGFSSGDYYPFLPNVFLFLAGAALMARWKNQPGGPPKWLYTPTPAPLRWVGVVGRYTLWIYLAHQPVILGILKLAGLL